MADNAKVIRDFYEAFDRHDGEAMVQHYSPDVTFEDPAFGVLHGDEAADMWRMLTGRAEDLRVELAEHEAEGDRGKARWIATYTFSTGRPVVNDIRARFEFRDGKITDHRDSFNFHRWARQALGPSGWVLGVYPLSLLVRRKALADLKTFRSERSAG